MIGAVISLRPSDAFMRQLTNQYCFRKWLVAWTAPSHFWNQCWDIVNWTLRNKLQWNLKRNAYIFIQENAFENVVWKMVAILSGPQCVKSFLLVQCQAFIWINAKLSSIGPLATQFIEFSIKIKPFSFKEIYFRIFILASISAHENTLWVCFYFCLLLSVNPDSRG